MNDSIALHVAQILNPVLGEHISEVEFADLVDDCVADFVEGLNGLRIAVAETV